MEEQYAIKVDNITKKFKIYYDKGKTLKEKVLFSKRRNYEERIVLDGISFKVKKGEAIGLIGHNGCGKSTTLKMLSRIMYPDSGSIEMNGRVSSLIELGAGFHPDMSGKENIYINASIFGLTKKEIDKRLKDIIEFSELEEFIDNPVRTYSSGMYMRLAFSVAINVDADILLIDEILAVGDANFQAKCFNRLREIKATGVTIILVTHDTDTVERFCDEAIWINEGKIIKAGRSDKVTDAYLNFMNDKKIEVLEREEQRKIDEKENEKNEKIESTSADADNDHDISQNSDDNKPEEIDYSANRFGLKYIEITKAEIINSKGQVTNVLKAGENIKIILHYKVNKPLEEYNFGIGFYNLDGVCIYGNNTQIDRIQVANIEDTGSIIFEVSELPLLSGRYILNVAVVDIDGTPMDFYRNYCTFDVVSKDRSQGCVSIRHKWITGN